MKKINYKSGIFQNNLNILKYINTNTYLNKAIIDIINENKFDIVIGVADSYSLILANISSKINAKVIGWQHNCHEVYFKTSGMRFYSQEILAKYMLNNLDEYICLTNYDRECIFSEFGIKCKTIHNPVSFESTEVSKLDKKNFLVACRLVKDKGVDKLIDAFKIFAEKNKEWNLTIVGDGAKREHIIKKINEYNLNDRIKVEHATSNIKPYYLNSSIYLLSSLWEGMPMVILESLEMGLPVISFDISAMKELVTSYENGILIEKYNVEKFAEAMLELAQNENLIKTMGKKSKERAEMFSWDKIEKEWNSLLNCEKEKIYENR